MGIVAFFFSMYTSRPRQSVLLTTTAEICHSVTMQIYVARRSRRVSGETPETYGYPNAALEAILFALLAYATVHGQPGNVPGATGARRAVVLGKIVPA